MNLKSREIMSSREINLAKSCHHEKIMSLRERNHVKSCHHEKIRSSRERNLVKSCHHEVLDSLCNMLMPNYRSRSVAAATTAAAAVAACGGCRLDAGLPRHRSHCHIQTAAAIAACSCLVLRSKITTTTLCNILDM